MKTYRMNNTLPISRTSRYYRRFRELFGYGNHSFVRVDMLRVTCSRKRSISKNGDGFYFGKVAGIVRTPVTSLWPGATLSCALQAHRRPCLWRSPIGRRVYMHVCGWCVAYTLKNGCGESDEVLPGERLRTFFTPSPQCVFIYFYFFCVRARCFVRP